MRILRYPLEVVEYQFVEPLWPGVPLSVAPGRRVDANGRELPLSAPEKIDLWAYEDESNRVSDLPILGVWIIGTGNPFPPDIDPNAQFRGTVVQPSGLVWHVFTATVGAVHGEKAPSAIRASSVDDMAEQIAARKRAREAAYLKGRQS